MLIGSTQCTPGYYNNEGKGWGNEVTAGGYPAGPLAFFHYLEKWRSEGFEGLEFR
jgi:hypothetical protein